MPWKSWGRGSKNSKSTLTRSFVSGSESEEEESEAARFEPFLDFDFDFSEGSMSIVAVVSGVSSRIGSLAILMMRLKIEGPNDFSELSRKLNFVHRRTANLLGRFGKYNNP